METQINIIKKVKLKDPVIIEGLPGIGNVGRVAAGYLISEMKMEKFAELISPHFLPLVLLQSDSAISLLKCEFYYKRGKDRDIVVLTGDTQSITPEGHYNVCETILAFAKKIGAKEIITLGGFAEGRNVAEPRVIGAVSDRALLKKYGKYGIIFGKDHPVGTIVGATGLLLGLGKNHSIEGLCLMGETFGLPVVTDPKAADKVLHILIKILKLKIDMTKFEKTIKEMEDHIKKTDTIHQKMMQEMSKPKKGEDVKYIG